MAVYDVCLEADKKVAAFGERPAGEKSMTTYFKEIIDFLNMFVQTILNKLHELPEKYAAIMLLYAFYKRGCWLVDKFSGVILGGLCFTLIWLMAAIL